VCLDERGERKKEGRGPGFFAEKKKGGLGASRARGGRKKRRGGERPTILFERKTDQLAAVLRSAVKRKGREKKEL